MYNQVTIKHEMQECVIMWGINFTILVARVFRRQLLSWNLSYACICNIYTGRLDRKMEYRWAFQAIILVPCNLGFGWPIWGRGQVYIIWSMLLWVQALQFHIVLFWCIFTGQRRFFLCQKMINSSALIFRASPPKST